MPSATPSPIAPRATRKHASWWSRLTNSPDDPAILDSLGWINFRLGNMDEAERLLRQALKEFPDHEVAAHLGEVLWTRGKQSEAREVWSEALKTQPDSPILRGTLQRLTGSETL